MVSERFDPSMAPDGSPSDPARFAAEASIKAAWDGAKGDEDPATTEHTSRKNKKKKRNKKNRHDRNAAAEANQEQPINPFLPAQELGKKSKKEKKAEKAKGPKETEEDNKAAGPAEATEDKDAENTGEHEDETAQDEGALDLNTPHEGEISIHDGEHPASKPSTEEEPATAKDNDQEQIHDQAEGETLEPVQVVDPQNVEISRPEAVHKQDQTPEQEPKPEPVMEREPVFEHEPTPPTPPGFAEFSQILMDQMPAPDHESYAAESAMPGHNSAPPMQEYEPAVQNERYARQAEATASAQQAPRSNMEANAGPYSSEIPPGLQRGASEVSRAAWTGLLAGWFLGRRGKRKAVEKAVQQERKRTIRSTSNPAFAARTPEQFQNPPLEAQPLHNYPTMPLGESSRTTVMPVSVETRQPRPKAVQTAEHPARQAVANTAPTIKNEAYRPIPNMPHKPTSEMGRSELVKIAKNVKVDGVSLKEVFAAKRIDQEGLRAVVETYLRGGDVKRQLTEEVVAKEQSFERDPFFRHQRLHGAGKLGSMAASVTASARSIAQEKGGQLAASSQKTAQKAGHVLANGAKQAQHDIIDNSNTLDWISITAIVVVWSLILILIF